MDNYTVTVEYEIDATSPEQAKAVIAQMVASGKCMVAKSIKVKVSK